MAYSLAKRIKNAWSAFNIKERPYSGDFSSSTRPDHRSLPYTDARTIVTSIYERIAVDIAAIDIHHSEVDINGKFLRDVKSGLNHILNVEANIDQSARAFMQDAVLTMLGQGHCAIVPITTETDSTSEDKDAIEVLEMRVGTVTEWMPKQVRVKVYNEDTGYDEEILLPKGIVAIIENPFYAVMNDEESIVKRLTRKLELLDILDENAGSNKLNLIFSMPYIVRGKEKEEHIKQRLKDIETQLSTSKYGIAYADQTEKIERIGGAVENNLFEQVQYFTEMLYAQLGLTPGVMDGTASAEEMTNYYNRTIEPILGSIVEELDRKFISKTAHAQGQTLVFYKDPFKLVTTDKLADIMDRLTRNEIISSNEARGIIGFRPIDDIRADELRNKNIAPTAYYNYPPAMTGLESTQFNGEAQPDVPVDPNTGLPIDPNTGLPIQQI